MALLAKLLVTLCLLRSGFTVNPYIWHLTDLHIDPFYGTDYDVNSCNEPLDHAGIYGNYECDPPYLMYDAVVKGMVDNGREPLFIIFSGDSPAHLKDDSGVTTDVIISYLQNVTNLLNVSFSDTQIVVSLGNYDYSPANQLPGSTNPVYEAAANMWQDWFGNDQGIIDTFTRGAYYSQLVDSDSKMRVVVFNSQLYAENNQATLEEDDPAGQYAWLTGVLAAARTSHEKVHMIMHTPPGVRPSPLVPRWLRDADNTHITDVIKEYSDVIVGVYSGHEHFDTFRILYKNGVPVTTLLMTPSVTPWRERETAEVTGMAHNPGIRKIYLDQYDGYLANLEQFFLDLDDANEDEAAVWLKLYSFTALYVNVNNLTAPTLHALTQQFMEYANGDFHKYYDYFSVGAHDLSNEPCSCECKFRHICSMENVLYEDFDSCFAGITCASGSSVISIVLLLMALVWTQLL